MTNRKSLKPSEYLKQFKSHYAGVPSLIMHKLPSAIVTMPIDCTVVGHLLFFNKFEFRFDVLTNNVSARVKHVRNEHIKYIEYMKIYNIIQF